MSTTLAPPSPSASQTLSAPQTLSAEPVRSDRLPSGPTATPPLGLLSRAEFEQWHEQGFLGPYTLVSSQEMAAARERIDADIFIGEANRPPPERNHDRHLDHAAVWRLCSAPPLVERVAGLLGPDIILWRTNFQDKPAGDGKVPWHQDGAYFGLQPCVLVSAWIAIDQATQANGCLQVVRGSHRSLRSHEDHPGRKAFSKELELSSDDLANVVSFEMEPGQFILFNEFTIHGSGPNGTGARRLGLSPRMTPPFVKVPAGWDGKPRAVSLLRGSDYLGLNRLMPPPV